MNIEKMREEFEAWILAEDWSKHMLLRRNQPGTPKDGEYSDARTRLAWDAWQASRAAIEVELRKDAERYQWLRDSSESIHQFYLSTPVWFTGVKFSKENVDNTIDAARSAEG